jgi:hypothetical protein
LLVTPPLLRWNVFVELGVPQLVGFLERAGVPTRQIDLNVELLYDYLTKPPWPERILAHRAHRCPAPAAWQGYLGGDGLCIPREDITAMRLWAESCDEHFELTDGRFELDSLLAAVGQGHGLYERYYEERLFGRVATPPALAGITFMSSSQLMPGLLLARAMKRHWPSSFVVGGGPWVSTADALLEPFLSRVPELDAVVLRRAEIPLLALHEALSGGRPLGSVPGVLVREGGQVRRTPPAPVLALQSLPPPCFDGLDLGRYPVPMVPVQTTSRCSWGRCVFCHHDDRTLAADARTASRVVDDMVRIRDRTGVGSFFFADCETPLDRMAAIAGEVAARRETLRWSALARAEQGYHPELCRTLRQGGCRALLFGLETSSERGLRLLRKGITADTVRRAVRCCGEQRIGAYLFVLDYPGNTVQELRDTLELVLSLAEWVEDFIPSRFQLSEVTQVAREPELLGIRRRPTRGLWLDVFDVPFAGPALVPAAEYARLAADAQQRLFRIRGTPRLDPFYRGTLD